MTHGRLPMTEGTCESGKRRYAARRDARAHLRALYAKGGEQRASRQHTYHCAECGGWHVGTNWHQGAPWTRHRGDKP